MLSAGLSERGKSRWEYVGAIRFSPQFLSTTRTNTSNSTILTVSFHTENWIVWHECFFLLSGFHLPPKHKHWNRCIKSFAQMDSQLFLGNSLPVTVTNSIEIHRKSSNIFPLTKRRIHFHNYPDIVWLRMFCRLFFWFLLIEENILCLIRNFLTSF